MKKMIKMAAAVITLVGAFSGMAFATPSAQIWIPSTDIQDFKTENDMIAQQNKQKEADYSYYSSDAYIEKIAKQNLGLVNPGEQVIVIPSTSQETAGGATADMTASDDTTGIKPLSNTQKWWNFFFDINHNKT